MTVIKILQAKEAEEVKLLLDRCVGHMTEYNEEKYSVARDAFQDKWGTYWATALKDLKLERTK